MENRNELFDLCKRVYKATGLDNLQIKYQDPETEEYWRQNQ